MANVIMVKKNSKGWYMCIDFTNLNAVCPKDSYPLLSIDNLVDKTLGCKLLIFMDAYFRYNQIKMRTENEDKTTFVTDQGTFCFRVMPFGLRNAYATFQRIIDKVFKEQIRLDVEVYVDDILVRSENVGYHLKYLQETFGNLSRVGLKLKVEKCAFGVTEGKFLSYMIMKEFIKPYLEKVQEVVVMEAPKTQKEVQRLNGGIATLSRHIPRFVDRCKHFFKLLKDGKQSMQWTGACNVAFLEFKTTLSQLPILQAPVQGETLTMYAATSETTVSAALVS